MGINKVIQKLMAMVLSVFFVLGMVPVSAVAETGSTNIFTKPHLSMYGVGYTAPSAKFTDIDNHWAKEDIDYVVGRGLLFGTSETTFSPNTAITRGMLVTVLGRLAGVDIKLYTTSSFIDVKVGSPFQPYIEWAYKKGIVQGIGNSQFAKDRAITREEIAAIFTNFAKATGYTLPVTREAITFVDDSNIGSVYKSTIMTMQQAGIMLGEHNNKFNPKATATRAEVSAMLKRYIKLSINPPAEGWVLNDDEQYLYYKDGKSLTGWQDIGSGNDKKTYYFAGDGIMISGKWSEIAGKWYYFNADGSLAKNTTIDGYQVDKNGATLEDPNKKDSSNNGSGGGTSNNDDGNYDPTPDLDPKQDLDVIDKDEDVVIYDDSEVGFTNISVPEDSGEELLQGVPMTNYLLYGYNVLKYGFINARNIDQKYAIFDNTKVEEVGEDGEKLYYKITEPTASEIQSLFSRSASSLYENFDISSSAKYKSLFFSGSVKADYGLTTTLNEEKILIKQIQYHETGNQSYIVDVDTLRGLLSEGFKNAVNKYAKKESPDYNPEKILQYYGTHAITQYYLGGRAELNYLFTNRDQADEETIKLSAEATYRGFSGKVQAGDDTKKKLVSENSTTKFKSIGGINISESDPREVAKKYDEWVKSIKEAPVLCGISNYDQSLIPIWELIADKDAADEVENAFVEEAKKCEVDLSQFDSRPMYITDIGVYSAKESDQAKNQVPNGFVMVKLNPGTSSTEILEANKGAGGNWIYIAYKLSPDKERAITNIQVVSGDNNKVTGDAGYTKIPVDLNEKAGGKYIYLCYKRITDNEKKDVNTKCLKEIRGIYTDSYSVTEPWEWPYKSQNENLNSGSRKSSASLIRLLVRKGP
ncbi:S-layer homology domain-containing protein [Desulfonispora thiosulfatigenes DSM 11270]|uniref:S-layer homology domain-containing protein n=1 Tax=Desulfonispora thiosulfatigenes DSM 11270 TaxID=656914 RepID=A0A1W1UJW7_DESTI|nr:S-layer homology domain-containing protein [Desulfonispora thiosulfatigenes]SMB81044.1 S-layer homology domain-containing protein [Desulfonispora thiosulfatigenes DSM 11270]